MSANPPEDTLESIRAERDRLQGMVNASARGGVATFLVEFTLPGGIRITGPSDREEAMATALADLLSAWREVMIDMQIRRAKLEALENFAVWIRQHQEEERSLMEDCTYVPDISGVLDEIEARVASLRDRETT